jgi:putative endonuclease
MKPVNKGRDAESDACSFLLSQGLRLLARNFRSRHGEIDLIMDDDGQLVFVEVRYRRGAAFGTGAESVDRRKQSRITACAQRYLQQHPEAARRPCRFDVVALTGTRENSDVDWIRDAFPALG